MEVDVRRSKQKKWKKEGCPSSRAEVGYSRSRGSAFCSIVPLSAGTSGLEARERGLESESVRMRSVKVVTFAWKDEQVSRKDGSSVNMQPIQSLLTQLHQIWHCDSE